MPGVGDSMPANAPIQIMVEGKPVSISELRKGEAEGPQSSHLWHGFPLEIHSGIADRLDLAAMSYPRLLIWHQKSGHTRNSMCSGIYQYASAMATGDFLLVPAGFEFDRGYSQNTDTMGTALEIRPETLQQLFPDEAIALDLSHFKIGLDKVLQNLFPLMEMELMSGSPSGALYAQSLSIALIEHLKQSYSVSKPLKRIGNRLSEQNLQTVKSYVQENLANDISLAHLADLVHISPYHFARLFKSTVGMTPYRYVMEQRLLEARRLLTTDRTIMDIASATGFASQAHLANLCRQRFGLSPTKLRKLNMQ